MVSLHKVCKKFGDTHVLNNITLTIESGSIVGLSGPSGGGKSTLLRCIQQLESIDSGTMKGISKSGFMFQDFQLFPHMTVLENLMYAPRLHSKKDPKSGAMATLKTLGMDHKADSFPSQLSGGQKQRVALARSLMMRPQLLLCDEPTSGLDVATIDDVVTLLKSVQGQGVTMILASHDLDFLTKIADRIIVLKGGIITLDMNPQTTPDPMGYLKKQGIE